MADNFPSYSPTILSFPCMTAAGPPSGTLLHAGSSSPQSQSPRSKENDVETNHVADFREDHAYEDHSNEKEYMIVPRTSLAPPVQQPSRSSPIPAALFVQPHRCNPISAASSAPPRNGDAHRFPHDDLSGKEVILYAIMRSVEPVAKGVIISSNPSTVLAGQALGQQYCEVVIRVVLKRDAKLPHPYAGVQEMADAKDLSIAWPYSRLKVCKVSKPSLGTGGRKQL